MENNWASSCFAIAVFLACWGPAPSFIRMSKCFQTTSGPVFGHVKTLLKAVSLCHYQLEPHMWQAALPGSQLNSSGRALRRYDEASVRKQKCTCFGSFGPIPNFLQHLAREFRIFKFAEQHIWPGTFAAGGCVCRLDVNEVSCPFLQLFGLLMSCYDFGFILLCDCIFVSSFVLMKLFLERTHMGTKCGRMWNLELLKHRQRPII